MKTILVPIDFSDVTTRVTDTAATLAKALGAELVLLFVAEPEPDFVGFEAGTEIVRPNIPVTVREESTSLEQERERLSESGVAVKALHVQGPIEDKIMSEAKRLEADLIVLGSHGHGALYHLLVGSVATEVLKKSKVPVMVVK